MNKFSYYSTKLLDFLIVVILAIMSFLVFLNVILRYGFNSSISVTEEVSRYMFVWLAFIGAILALKDNLHVSVNALVDKLSNKARIYLNIITHLLMLYCCYLILIGSWTQCQLNWSNMAPISGVPIGVTFLASVIASIGMGIVIISRLFTNFKLLVGRGVK